jgi:succinate dehydrogenase/fumarate reductase flavoprotein subunit
MMVDSNGERFMILNKEKEVIPGLYAVGAMANRLYYNRNYLSGSQLTFGASTGRLAAEHIISNISE